MVIDPKRLAAYRQASPLQRQLLQLCALKYDGISRTQLFELIKWLELGRGGASIKQADAKAAIDALFTRGLLVKESDLRTRAVADLIDLAVQDTVRERTFAPYAGAVRQMFPLQGKHSWQSFYPDDGAIARDARIAFYLHDVDQLDGLLKQWNPRRGKLELGLLQPFDAAIFGSLIEPLRRWHLLVGIDRALHHGEGSAELLGWAEQLFSAAQNDDVRTAWIDLSVARGDLRTLQRIGQQTAADVIEATACAAFLGGDPATAERGFEAAVKRLRGGSARQILVPHLAGLLHLLILLRENTLAARIRAIKMTRAGMKQWPAHWSAAVETVQQAFTLQAAPRQTAVVRAVGESRLALLLAGCIWYWYRSNGKPPFDPREMEETASAYGALGLDWLAVQASRLAEIGRPRSRNAIGVLSDSSQSANSPATSVGAPAASGASDTVNLVDWIQPVRAWERALTALEELVAKEQPSPTSVAAGIERMIWQLEYNVEGAWLNVQPFIQKRTKSGWTVGRPVSLRGLHSGLAKDTYAYLDDSDRAICRTLEEQVISRNYGHYTDVSYGFDDVKLARALVGHPRVYAKDERSHPIEIAAREPQLVITKTEQGAVRIVLDPRPREFGLFIREDGPHRLEVVIFSDRHQQLDEIIGKSLVVPASQSDRVLEAARSVSTLVAIHSEIGAAAGGAEMVALDSRPHLHLVPHQQGLRVELFVRPFSTSGPFFRPGQGGEMVFADVDGAPKSGRRRLDQECVAAAAVVAACPSLGMQSLEVEGAGTHSLGKQSLGKQSLGTQGVGRHGESDNVGFYFATELEALELLVELQPLVVSEKVILHWPHGRKLSLAGEVRASQFQLRIRKDRDWFAASGELVVDDSLSLDMIRMMEMVDASASRFIQLDDGRFLALTEELRRRVADLGAVGQRHKSKVRFSPVHVAALDNLGDSVKLNVDEHWRQCIVRMREARDLEPQVPSTFQADLRDYQREGFAWLSRLAHWGVGGCLADDMGLGKTVQALALLSERGAGGPALVVCPTSVGFNWQSECSRFAPTLTARPFGPGDREAFVKQLGPRDVVICSYGLLHHQAELLQAVAWHTVILDEAQAIKNMATKRSQAVMSLEADFRLIMTGTPLENHLGELWNLFNFINPGLLGSHESFTRRFTAAIVRNDDHDATRRLKRLIQPFILRRTKTQVLDELPSRTEITLLVELSKEETALYEALRRRAIDKLAEKDADEGPKHLQILAEIMRLRRACCHPRLVIEDSKISSSKLAVFCEVLDELLNNHHKALVFSQFVGHLEVLREELERKGVSYQYLDGSTPAAKRREAVEAFQSGVGDVFLISLKAGGQGLNLTAADYVIHMDPWWNPAVEDQASDRAHRIGQQRPVTIYRLVAKGTIEERIVELHKTKRDLADTLLEGADMSGKLTGEQLLELLRE